MNMLNLKKQNEPDFGELKRMLSELGDFLNETPDFNDKEWKDNLTTILDFQDLDGGFKVYSSSRMPSDARVDFCYMPTYVCTAILMKAYLLEFDAITIREKSALKNGLKMSCARNLRGHGYGAFKDQIEALNIFMNAGLNEFIDLHADLCPEFAEMIEKIISQFKDRQSQAKFTGTWGESYETEIREVNEYFSNRKVFVYGTLMEGESNHDYLENSECLGKAFIEGYDMYDVGFYPAIVPGDSLIVGELYDVPLEDMPSIDMLEGEGSLYVKKCEAVSDYSGNISIAFVYVYLGEVESLERISAWNEEYVWYVSYGSNMLKKRFMHYIEGGSFEGSTPRDACEDTSHPVAVKTVEIPYGMYFGKKSRTWDYGGVSFLDITKKGKSLGVAYLITKKQFRHVSCQENGGKAPEKSNGWYTDVINLDMMDGFEVKTVTNKFIRTYNNPSPRYLNTLIRGIRQNWPEMSDEEIEDYLNSCMR